MKTAMIKYTNKYNLYYIDDIVFIESIDKIKKVKRDIFFDRYCVYDKVLMVNRPIENKIDTLMKG